MTTAKAPEKRPRNEKLSIPLPFEDTIRAVLRVKPEAPPPAPKKTPKETPRPSQRRSASP